MTTPPQRSALVELVTDWGMIAGTADSGPAALTILRTAAGQDQPFSVVLLERSMTDEAGLSLKDSHRGRSEPRHCPWSF